MGRTIETAPAAVTATGRSVASAAISVQPDLQLGSFSGPVEVQHTGPVPTQLRAIPSELRRPLPDTDLSVYPFALGCSVFGWTADGDTSMRILDAHRDRGGNFLDTADSYATGRSEVLVGTWLRSRGVRDETVVATKIGRNRDFPGLSAPSIIGAVNASLERLGTDHIDLLYFHFDDRTVPLEESLGAVDVLIRAGKVRYLAASNFGAERLMEARVLSANGLPKFVALQTHYNLVYRTEFESSLELVTRAQGLAVLPYFALAHGFLSGRYRTKNDIADDARGRRITPYLHRRTLRVLSVVERIAAAQQVDPTTIALAWLLARGMLAPVASVSEPGQLDDLMKANEITIGRGEMQELDRIRV